MSVDWTPAWVVGVPDDAESGGTGSRWAIVGENGEVTGVRTPHVGRVAEFYRLRGGELQIGGEARGYSSHVMGSRNLDAGLAGDVDGDGRVELLVPTADRRALGAVRRVGGGAEGAWMVGLGGELTTNLGAVEAGGRVTVPAGWDGAVRFWPGQRNS